ncbi:MAG: hypothetical protein AB7O62_17685 [Pirellulales bacterium]
MPRFQKILSSKIAQTGLFGLITAGALACLPGHIWAITPDSPEVKEVVAKAKVYLGRQAGGSSSGQKVLCGYAMLKAGHDANDPVVQLARDAIYAEHGPLTRTSYEASIFLLFLVNLDAEANRAKIEELHAKLLQIQKPFGAWGYIDQGTGDTSMTQYATLTLWELDHKGFKTPEEVWGKACNWFLRTQDPSGTWAYQAQDPGSFTLITQDPLTTNQHSLAAGAAGSLYIMSDHFGLAAPEPKAENEKDIPDALKVVGGKKEKKSSAMAAGVDASRIHAALQRADAWHDTNFTPNPKKYDYYYLYAYERYQAFKAVAERRPVDDEEAWYDAGFEFLKRMQLSDGSWNYGNLAILENTAFGILFLVRPSKKSLADRASDLGSGSLIGGHGLPKSGEELRERAGKLGPKPLRGPADAMLKIIEDPDNPDLSRAAAGLGEFVMEADEATLSKLAGQLRGLANGKSPEARALAIKALARTRNLDDVPLLIAALADPAETVAQEAHSGLRFLSRKFTSISPDIPERGADRRLATERWKAWFRSVRPNAEFLE